MGGVSTHLSVWSSHEKLMIRDASLAAQVVKSESTSHTQRARKWNIVERAKKRGSRYITVHGRSCSIRVFGPYRYTAVATRWMFNRDRGHTPRGIKRKAFIYFFFFFEFTHTISFYSRAGFSYWIGIYRLKNPLFLSLSSPLEDEGKNGF